MVRVATTRTTRFVVDKADNACKKEPRRGDGAQAGVKPLLSIRKKKKPQRGDGTAACPLSFRHSFGVLMVRMLSYRGCATAYPCLRSVAPLGLTIHTTLSQTRVLMSAVHSSQAGVLRDSPPACILSHLQRSILCRPFTQGVALG